MSEAPLKNGSGRPEQRAKNSMHLIVGQHKPIQLPSFKVEYKITCRLTKVNNVIITTFSVCLSLALCRLKRSLTPALQKTHITHHLRISKKQNLKTQVSYWRWLTIFKIKVECCMSDCWSYPPHPPHALELTKVYDADKCQSDGADLRSGRCVSLRRRHARPLLLDTDDEEEDGDTQNDDMILYQEEDRDTLLSQVRSCISKLNWIIQMSKVMIIVEYMCFKVITSWIKKQIQTFKHVRLY